MGYPITYQVGNRVSENWRTLTPFTIERVIKLMGLTEGFKDLVVQIQDSFFEGAPALIGKYVPGKNVQHIIMSLSAAKKVTEERFQGKSSNKPSPLKSQEKDFFEKIYLLNLAHETCHYVQDCKGGLTMSGEESNAIYARDPQAYFHLPHEREADIVGALFSGIKVHGVSEEEIKEYKQRDPKLRGFGFEI